MGCYELVLCGRMAFAWRVARAMVFVGGWRRCPFWSHGELRRWWLSGTAEGGAKGTHGASQGCGSGVVIEVKLRIPALTVVETTIRTDEESGNTTQQARRGDGLVRVAGVVRKVRHVV